MTQFVFNGVEMNEDQFMDALNASQEIMMREQEEIREEYNVSNETASAIMYLRGRSRWTSAKETELVNRDHAGNPIPMNLVLQGEF
jgi:hypothetical protein